MQNKKMDKVIFFAAPVVLFLLFILNIAGDSGLSTTASMMSVGIFISFVAYFLGSRHRKNHPINTLIEKDGEMIVFHHIYGPQKPPLKVEVSAIYALNFSYRYLGVILNNNGRGYDFQYPHKTVTIKERLRAVLGEDAFSKIKVNT